MRRSQDKSASLHLCAGTHTAPRVDSGEASCTPVCSQRGPPPPKTLASQLALKQERGRTQSHLGSPPYRPWTAPAASPTATSDLMRVWMQGGETDIPIRSKWTLSAHSVFKGQETRIRSTPPPNSINAQARGRRGPGKSPAVLRGDAQGVDLRGLTAPTEQCMWSVAVDVGKDVSPSGLTP